MVISEERIKLSFSKAKEHADRLENDIKELKTLLNNQNKEIISLKSEIKDIFSSNKQIEPLNEPKTSISTGNKGVLRQSFDSTSTVLNQEIEPIKQEIEENFKKLTEKQFLVFMSIYELEEQKDSPIRYKDIAEHLNLTQSSVRDHVNELTIKKIPLTKEIFNNKVFLSIPQEFRTLTLASKLLNFRQLSNNQKTLFDGYTL
tara:strand:+ start:43 stop:648 length:606 start_codon:yes stop_codon:yes gene_type:complete